jgi:hypothetical protein
MANMQVEEQDRPVTMLGNAPETQSAESKPGRGGKRQGAGRKPNIARRLTGEYARSMAEPAVHTAAIKARGNMPIFIDPASNASNQIDGRKLFEIYRRSGLNVFMADNGRDAGFFEVWTRLSTGRLKIFQSCKRWLERSNHPGSQIPWNGSNSLLTAQHPEQLAPSKAKSANPSCRIQIPKSGFDAVDAMRQGHSGRN